MFLFHDKLISLINALVTILIIIIAETELDMHRNEYLNVMTIDKAQRKWGKKTSFIYLSMRVEQNQCKIVVDCKRGKQYVNNVRLTIM